MPQYDESFVDLYTRKRKYRVGPVKKYYSVFKRKQYYYDIKQLPLLISVTPVREDYNEGECDSQSPSPLAGSGPGGHKASFRSTKLARRARSFKEDFLEKISQMRSPAIGGMQGGARPHSPKTRTIKNDGDHQDKSPTREINSMVKQVQIALIHFRDVVAKDKLEMLSGNGTIVLDTVLSILSALKPLINSDQSSTISSASNQVYQSLARLIKLCDDVLLNGNQSSALDQENVGEVVTLLEDAVKNLVKVAQEKIINRESTYKTAPRSSFCNANLDLPAQRNSLPDIPLTPRERQILEQTSCVPGLVRSSHSSESILRENSPPPKPPLPDGICLSEADSNSLGTPPPLPPKKRTQRTQQLIGECCNSDSSLLACSLDRMSFRSKSPEDSSSLLSASAGSLDSVLNHSREEEEIRALMDHQLDESRRENDISDIACAHTTNGNCTTTYDDSFCSTQNISAMNHISELQSLDTNRLSNTDSGFVSIHSHRNSVQSYNASKRSSQQSSSSQRSSQQNSLKLSSANSVQAETINLHKSESIVQNLSVVASEKVETSVSFTSATTTTFSQHSSLSSSQMSDLSVLHSIVDGSDVVDQYRLSDEGLPPAIPQKTRSRRGRHERQPSPYDNVPLENIGGELIPCSMHQSQDGNGVDVENAKPPPLPVKKRHIMAYMEMFGNCSHSNDNEFLRHSVHFAQQHQQAQWQNQQSLDTTGLTTTQSCSFVHSSSTSSSQTIQHASNLTIASMDHHNKLNLSTSPLRSPNSISPNSNGLPPALPPKRSRASSTKSSTSPPPPASPTNPLASFTTSTTPHTIINSSSNNNNNSNNTNNNTILPSPNIVTSKHASATSTDLKLSPKPMRNATKSSEAITKPLIITSTPVATHKQQKESKNAEQNLKNTDKSDNEVNNDVDLMEDLDVKKFITMKKQDEDGPDIRGGYIDALIVHATKPTKNDFSYQEAFLTTYRTFISPYDLITKLIRRHQYFICQPERKPRANEAFSLLVRVVKDLTISDLEDQLVQVIMNFIYQLVSSGNLGPAKPLRITLIDKYNLKIFQMKTSNPLSLSLAAGCATLLDFKSEQIAEQMTLLDANLFMKIEIPEVLIWAQEQNEERSPNLTRFTEHFNKMSYWARTKILQSEAKDREKYVMKFIKIMKHLRKINNFNSYLALLSALDSAPIRRLEWQKHITEGLKEYCALIDSSSSFRAYRQALAETSPPCIPYIGLVLQDLTFVHIGNSNLLQDGTINFSKRWQQFNIVENMKRFKKCSFTFKKNERIIAFFQNFDYYIVEDAMWQISESIKPRGGKKVIQ